MEAKMMDIPGFVSFMRYYAGYAVGIASINSSAMHAVHSLCTSNPPLCPTAASSEALSGV